MTWRARNATTLVDLADIIKLDVLALTDTELVDAVERLSAHGVTLLVEKIETNEMLRHCLDLGFEMFQGNFYLNPCRLLAESSLIKYGPNC